MTKLTKMLLALLVFLTVGLTVTGTAVACGSYGPPSPAMVEEQIEWTENNLAAAVEDGDLERARGYMDRLVTLSDQLAELRAEQELVAAE